MSTPPLRLTSVARGSHVEVVSSARDALGSSGACILDFHMFSNAILCLNFEIAPSRLPLLATALAQAGIRLYDQSLTALRQVAADTASLAADPHGDRIEGSLSVNLINDEPVLRIEVPAVPG